MANVNQPTNTAIKERDINQKLQLYGIFTAFSNGKVPSNKQIDVALNSALASRPLASPSKKLSSEGQALVADLKEVIKQAKYLLLSKNQGNLLQDFIWDAQHIDGGNTSLPGAPIDKSTAQQHGNQAVDGLKTLGRLILSNGQFRKLLDDATILIRDMAGDAAQNAANKVNPDEERLKRIDEPAEDNTWHDVPELSRDNLKNQAKGTFNKNKPFDQNEARDAAQQGMNTAQDHPTQDNQEAGRVGASRATDNLKDRARQNIPDEHQENAKKAKGAAVQNTKAYMGKKMPQERRDQTIWRLKKMVVEIQGHSDYQQAIETLLSLAEEYGGHATNITQQSAGTVKGAHSDNSLQSVEANLKTLIERFANSTSTDDLFDSLNDLYRDADRDPELKNWFKSVDRFVRKCLQEQGFILQDQANNEWNKLYDQGQFLFRDRYRDHTDHLLDEIKFLADQFDQDPQNQAFGQAVQKLFLDLGQDENGQPKFKPHLLKDLYEVIIPGIFENTRYVPIPRIEVSDPMVDVVVENLVIESDNLFPNVFEFGNDNYFRLGRKSVASKAEQKVMIAGSGIQMDLRDVAYYIKKKQGFPSITDKGVMDIILAGEGFSFKLAARNANKSDRTHFVAVDKVDVTIKNLAIKVKKSNHKLLFNIAKPILLKVMRPAIQKIIEKQIKDNFEKADAFAYSIYKEVQRGAEAAANDPDNASNIFNRYSNAFQAKMTEKKKKAEAKASNTQVNMAITKQDSIFKNISLPGGISTKATEYKELAGKGDRWESPIFGIGSARESSDIPKLSSVSRKPHNSRAAGIRGGNHPSESTSSNFGSSNTPTGQSAGGYGSTGQSGYGSTGQSGYGSTGQSGYGSTGQPTGYSDAPTSGYGSGPTSGYTGTGTGTGVPSGGFSNQVDQAFNKETNAPHANGGNAGAASFYDGVTQR